VPLDPARHELGKLEEPMNPPDQDRLERLIDSELRALPDLTAPDNLLKQVMAAVQERATRPWWRRSWQDWPPGLQAVALLLLLGVAGSVSYLGAVVLDEIRMFGLETVMTGWLEPWNVVRELAGTVWRAGLLVFHAGGQQVFLLTVAFVLGVYFACVGLGTAFTQIGSNRT
jgi:hypothetical protein